MKKRVIALALTAIMALSLAACGGGGTTTREDTNASSGAAAGGSSAKVKVDPYAGDEVQATKLRSLISHMISELPTTRAGKRVSRESADPGPTSR